MGSIAGADRDPNNRMKPQLEEWSFKKDLFLKSMENKAVAGVAIATALSPLLPCHEHITAGAIAVSLGLGLLAYKDVMSSLKSRRIIGKYWSWKGYKNQAIQRHTKPSKPLSEAVHFVLPAKIPQLSLKNNLVENLASIIGSFVYFDKETDLILDKPACNRELDALESASKNDFLVDALGRLTISAITFGAVSAYGCWKYGWIERGLNLL